MIPNLAAQSPLYNTLWPGRGYQGAAMSPYLRLVEPLAQSYSAVEALLPQAAGNSLGPAQIDPVKPQGPPGGKGEGALDTIFGLGAKLTPGMSGK
jgi:hypothetical protein